MFFPHLTEKQFWRALAAPSRPYFIYRRPHLSLHFQLSFFLKNSSSPRLFSQCPLDFLSTMLMLPGRS